jgi:hypothetical protein
MDDVALNDALRAIRRHRKEGGDHLEQMARDHYAPQMAFLKTTRRCMICAKGYTLADSLGKWQCRWVPQTIKYGGRSMQANPNTAGYASVQVLPTAYVLHSDHREDRVSFTREDDERVPLLIFSMLKMKPRREAIIDTVIHYSAQSWNQHLNNQRIDVERSYVVVRKFQPNVHNVYVGDGKGGDDV